MIESLGVRRLRLTWPNLLVAAAAILLLIFIVLPPHDFHAKLHLIGYGICHQLPERSFYIAGKQLPLCARCTGTYLGALLGLGIALSSKKRRARGLPDVPILAFAVLGFVFFAVDGLNSYATLFPRLPHLYTPDNRLRLLSGMACGAGIIIVIAPLFNYVFWAQPDDETMLSNWVLLPLLGGFGVIFFAVVFGRGWLYDILAAASMFGVIIVLSLVNGLLALVLGKRENRAQSWGATVYLLAAGLLMMAAEVGALGYLRSLLERGV